MRNIFYFFILLAIGTNPLTAQKKITVDVQSETSYDKILPPDMIYEFDAFQPGSLYYKNGTVVTNNFNYNLLTCCLLFKSKDGRDLEFAFPEQLSMVMIDSCYWIPLQEGFGKIVYHKEQLDLVKYRVTKCTDIRKKDGFGGSSSTSSVTSITSFRGSGNGTVSLSVAGEYDFETEVIYFLRFGDTIDIADARGFKKIFPQNKSLISKEMKNRNLNLSKQEDIITLIHVITANQ